jgi:hypothetical protein
MSRNGTKKTGAAQGDRKNEGNLNLIPEDFELLIPILRIPFASYSRLSGQTMVHRSRLSRCAGDRCRMG